MGRECPELAEIKIARNAPPGLEPASRRAGDGIDADELDAAQDERCDRGGKVHALSQSAGGNRRFRHHLGEHIGEGRRAHGIDGTRPARLGERLDRRCKFVAVDDPRGSETFEERLFGGSSGRSDDRKAQL